MAPTSHAGRKEGREEGRKGEGDRREEREREVHILTNHHVPKHFCTYLPSKKLWLKYITGF